MDYSGAAEDSIELVCRGEKKKTPSGDQVVYIRVEETETEGSHGSLAGHVHSENNGESARTRRIDSDGAAERASRDKTRDIYWVSTRCDHKT